MGNVNRGKGGGGERFYLGVEVAAHGFLGPRLEVELGPPLLLWVAHHIRHGLIGDREEDIIQ